MSAYKAAFAVVVAIVVAGLPLAYDVWKPNQPDITEMSDFSARYTRARELLDYFSECPPPTSRRTSSLVDDRIAVNERFASARKLIRNSPYYDQSRIIDRQLQVLADPSGSNALEPFSSCERLAFLAPVGKGEVLKSIAYTEMAIRDSKVGY